MKEKDFNAELQRIVDTTNGSITIDYDYAEDNLRQIYLKKISRKFICEVLSERKLNAYAIFPIKCGFGALIKIKRKLLKG